MTVTHWIRKNLTMLGTMLLTAIGSLGGFQDPPKFLKNAYASRFFQFLLLFVLVLQGGGGMQFMPSFIFSVCFYGLIELIKYLEKVYETKKASSDDEE